MNALLTTLGLICCRATEGEHTTAFGWQSARRSNASCSLKLFQQDACACMIQLIIKISPVRDWRSTPTYCQLQSHMTQKLGQK